MDIKKLVTSIVNSLNPISKYAGEDSYVIDTNEELNHQLVDQLTDLVEDIQMHSIVNFWLSLHNMGKHNLIENVFANQPENIKEILNQRLESNDYDIVKFIGSLDEEKRGILIRHIMYNYKGITLEKVQEYYNDDKTRTVGHPAPPESILEPIKSGNPIQMEKRERVLIVSYDRGQWYFNMHGATQFVCKNDKKAMAKIREYQQKGFKI